MRFSIQKDLLQKAIDVAILAVDKKEQDVRSTLLFDVGSGGELVLWSSDRQQMAKVPTSVVPGTLQGQGQFTVEADRLQKWIKNVQDEVVAAEVKDRTVTMTCGSAKGHFASRDPLEFPDFQAQLKSPEHLFNSDPETIINALKFVTPFIGEGTTNNEVANNMQVAELRGKEMQATDAISVSIYMASEDNENFGPYIKLLEEDEKARKEAEEALKRGEEVGPIPDHTFRVSSDEIKNLVRFLDKTCVSECVVSKKDVFLVESDDGSVFGFNAPIYQLPNISGLPKDLDEPEVWVLDRDRLKSAVNTLTATADPEDVSLTLRLSGEGEEAILTLAMQDALERNESTYKLPIERERVSQPELEFVVNWERLINPLSLYDGDEVRVGVNAHDGARARYLKYYESTETEDTRIAIVTLRKG